MKTLLLFLLPLTLFAIHYENCGPIHILTVEPQKYRFEIGLAQNEGLGVEPVSSMAKRTGAIAAINGGFFQDEVGAYIGASAGSLKIHNTYLSTCRKNRAVIAWNSGEDPIIDRILLKATVNGRAVDKLNDHRKDTDVILFSWPFHRETLTTPGGTEYAISKELKIIGISRDGNMAIPENGYVLSVGRGAYFPGFTLGDRVAIDFQADHPKWNAFKNMMDGTPVLIQNGKAISDYSQEQVIETFITKQHPRTAIGIKSNGDWVFVAVEGRSEQAPGMTLEELTDLLLSLGCTDAVNLDGGGSTTLFYDGKIVNTPADADYKGRRFELAVANCILVFPKK